jgi:hypothetical protein
MDRADVAVAYIDHRSVRLVLHNGGAIPPDTLGNVAAAFNGAFKLGGQSGMLLDGTQIGTVAEGMAAVVGYGDGGFDVGQWGRDVPSLNRPVLFARSNLELLVDGGAPSPAAANWGVWGAVLKGQGPHTARAAVGVTADGHLVWAGAMHVLPGTLAAVLIDAGVVRAMELDINPMWVAFFTFQAGEPTPMVPGQIRPATTYIAGWNRDFFTVEHA